VSYIIIILFGFTTKPLWLELMELMSVGFFQHICTGTFQSNKLSVTNNIWRSRPEKTIDP